ncbi:MAG: hypothetical protein ACR2HR_14250 [Euzebya sp.]
MDWPPTCGPATVESGFAYLVGSNAGLVVQDQCRSGQHMVDIRIPLASVFAGCYLMDGGPATGAGAIGYNSPSVAGVRVTGAYVDLAGQLHLSRRGLHPPGLADRGPALLPAR